MNTLICPISTERVNGKAVRLIGFEVALTTILYAFTGSVWFMAALLFDFIIRGFLDSRYSPLALVAKQLTTRLHLEPKMIDKAPKLFAARVGFIFSLTAVVLAFISPVASLVVALILMVFALLESLADFCVGCLVYTYVVLPLNKS